MIMLAIPEHVWAVGDEPIPKADTDNCPQWEYWYVVYFKQRKVDIACVLIILELNIAIVFCILLTAFYWSFQNIVLTQHKNFKCNA